MKFMKNRIVMMVAVGACLLALSASANTISFTSSSGPSASATFITGADTLGITLNNNTADPGSVADCLSALGFSITGPNAGSLTAGSLFSSSGMERSVADNGTYTAGAAVAAGWVLTAGSSWSLNVLTGIGHAGPEHTLIGAPNGLDVYGAANRSITGNGPHNPFLAGPLTFTLTVPGLTADNSISMDYFQFGTENVPHVAPNVPDGGATALLLGVALTGLGLIRRLRG